MKNKTPFILSKLQKRMGTAVVALCMILTLDAGQIFAYSNSAEEADLSYFQTYSSVFNENNFSDMFIAYDENGVPIVIDSNSKYSRAGVTATARYSKNGFYSSIECSSSDLLFYILKDTVVQVIDNQVSKSVVKVKYAGTEGYMKKSELVF